MNKRIINLFFFFSLFFLLNSTRIFSQVGSTPYLRITSPNGGEKWEANSTQTITWQSSNIARIKIEYSLSGGMGWHLVADSVDASLGKYSWTVPDVQITEVLIRINDMPNPSIFDVSNSQFQIYIGAATKKSRTLNKTTTVTSSTTVKIMPLGDSITEGEGDNGGNYVSYRAELWHLLYQAGFNFTFVGSQNSGTSSHTGESFDNSHEGHGGWVGYPFPSNPSTDTMALSNSLNGFLTSNPPDIILLHIGTNDVNENHWDSFENSPLSNDIKPLLNIIYSYNPGIVTFLAKIIDQANRDAFHPALHDSTIALNGQIQTLLFDKLLIDQQSKVKLVDMYNALGEYNANTTNFSSDKLHPSVAGYTLMADTWYAALQNYLPLLQLNVFLEGPYAGGGMMTHDLRDLDLIPQTSPYQDYQNKSQYLNGSNYVVVPYTIPTDITDWIQVEIRGDDGSTVIEKKSCFLRNDGVVLDPDNLSENISLGITPGNYYIVVKHRNHLAIMSSDLVKLDGLTTYDFTDLQSKAYSRGADGMVTVSGGKFAMWAGDANSNGTIDATDFNNYWFIENGNPYDYSTTPADFNLNGTIDATDFNNFWFLNNSKSTQIP